MPTCKNHDHASYRHPRSSSLNITPCPLNRIVTKIHIMQRKCFIVLVASLEFFHIVCSDSGITSENSLSDNNNSANSPSESSSNTTILNNMLAREILHRQVLENKVATLERQITALIGDVANGQRACSVLQRDVQGISLRQNNMASSLQTITQRVDSKNVNMKASLRNLSNITSKLLRKDTQCKYCNLSMYHFYIIAIFSFFLPNLNYVHHIV